MLSKEMREKLMGEIGRNDKFIELIGIRIVELDEGYCKGELEVTDQHISGKRRSFKSAGGCCKTSHRIRQRVQASAMNSSQWIHMLISDFQFTFTISFI